MAADKFYVRIVRVTDDGSITYKGPMPPERATKEAGAWRQAFPGYLVEILGVNSETVRMVAEWDRVISTGSRFYGPEDWRDEMRKVVRA